MRYFKDKFRRKIRFTLERYTHILDSHPELRRQKQRIKETLLDPEIVIQSLSDNKVELFYRQYHVTPVGIKFMCVVVKNINHD